MENSCYSAHRLHFFISVILTLSWAHSSHSPWLNIGFIDNSTFIFTPLWHSRIGLVLIITWSLTLILLICVTQLRNIFWYSGAFLCTAYIFTLIVLLSSTSSSDHSWNQARLFETLRHAERTAAEGFCFTAIISYRQRL